MFLNELKRVSAITIGIANTIASPETEGDSKTSQHEKVVDFGNVDLAFVLR